MAIEKPVLEELAEPESLFSSGLLTNGSKFTELLVPQDSVLAQKGRDYRVYREVLRDDQCMSCLQQRRDAIIEATWDVEPASDSAIDVSAGDFIRENLKALDFDSATRGMHFGLWYGHAVGECMWAYDGARIFLKDIHVRDRARFAYDSQRQLWLRRIVGPEQLMPERKFWRFSTGADHDDEPYGLGLAHYAYWPVFFKRNDIKFWMVFQEKFASPTVTGKVPSGTFNDPAMRTKVLAELRRFSTDTAIIIPDGVEVTLLEATRSGATSYKELCDAMDSALAKIILSQTMTTDNGSSRSQSETHADVRDMVIKSDADLLCSSLNRGPITWLTEWNFPGAKPPRVWRNTEPAEDLNKRAERDAKVYTLGYEPTEEYVTEIYGDGWQKRAVQAGLTPNDVAAAAAQNFAELGVLAAAKGARRLDQGELVEASRKFANRYESILGKRVKQLVDFADTSGDYETFRTRLLGMMSEVAPEDVTSPVVRSGLLARLLGRFRAQR